MKKFLKFLAVAVIAVAAFAGIAHADRTDSNPFYLDANGVNWLTNDPLYELGSSAQRIAKIWASSIDTTTISIGGASSFTQGSSIFAGPSGVLAQDNANLFFDDTNNYFGVGTATPSSRLDLTTAGLGTAQTQTSGLALVNTTAAAAGLQQISPAVRWKGFAWKSTATAASQPVEFMAYVLPVQGTSAPTAEWHLQSSINGAAYGDALTVSDSGVVTATQTLIGSAGIQSHATGTLGNLWVTSARSAVTTTSAPYLIAGATSVFMRTGFNGTTNTTLSTGVSYASVNLAKALITTFTSGTHAMMANLSVSPITITNSGATVTNAATINVEGPGTGGTFNSSLYVLSGLASLRSTSAAIRTVTTTATLDFNDSTVLCDATGGAVTINLPTVASTYNTVNTSGITYVVKKIDATANACTIDGSGAETIDGAATKAITTQYNNSAVQSNGTAWYIVN